MTKSEQDKALNNLLRPLSKGVPLDNPDPEITASDETQIDWEHRPLLDRLTAIDSFAGWSTALDPPALAMRKRVLDSIEQWLPSASEMFINGVFPDDLFQDLGSIGAIGASLVGRNGNPPLSKIATCAIMHSVEYGDGGLRCALTVHDSVIQALIRFGSKEQQQHWLEPLLKGDIVSAFALTEPNAGSDIRSISTKATRSGDDWVLSGSKSWVTNGPRADLILVWARTGEGNDAIRGFLIEKGTPGLTIETITTVSSMRIAPVGYMCLDQVRVSHSALLPHAWGLMDINACLDYNRLSVLFGVMGGARQCLDIAIRYATTRHQFGMPIAGKQLVQTMLADMAERVAMGEMVSLQLARRWEIGPLSRFDVSLAKRNNCAAALEVARMARTILGANGVDLARHIMRHLLNLEASYSYGGTHEIHGLVIGKELTGESAF